MTTILHVVDAFTGVPFRGNPAAVCVLEAEVDPSWMQMVAREMNLSETAFLHPIAGAEGDYALRWFTPTVEVELCGHATLASAFVLWETGRLERKAAARFLTRSGWLVCKSEGSVIAMDFPAMTVTPGAESERVTAALGAEAVAVFESALDYLVEVENESSLMALQPDLAAVAQLGKRGVIVTCRSERAEFDFISRYFAPAVGVNEDPVTGSAHCVLGPYWQSRLNRSEFHAYQASARGGVVDVAVRGDRVELRGQAVMMSRVELLV